MAALPHLLRRRRLERENDGAQQIGIRTGRSERDADAGGAFHDAGSNLEQPQALGGSGDQGIDGVIHQDPLGLDRVYIQAKRYNEGNVVGSGAIRDFNGALDLKRAPKGLFVTASSFSRDARIQAESATRKIVLIDGEELASLMIRHKVGTRVVATVDIQEVDGAFFGD